MPRDLVRARERFRAWRRKRSPGVRIPEPLWELAVKLADAHGLHRTSSALGLDYYSLKKRLDAACSASIGTANGRQHASASGLSETPAVPAAGSMETPAAGFIELSAPLPVAKRCRIELNDGSGATMRVQLVGYDAADVVALSRSIWKAE